MYSYLLIPLSVLLEAAALPEASVYLQSQKGGDNIHVHVKNFKVQVVIADDNPSNNSQDDYDYDSGHFTLKPTSGTSSTVASDITSEEGDLHVALDVSNGGSSEVGSSSTADSSSSSTGAHSSSTADSSSSSTGAHSSTTADSSSSSTGAHISTTADSSSSSTGAHSSTTAKSDLDGSNGGNTDAEATSHNVASTKCAPGLLKDSSGRCRKSLTSE